MVIENKFSLIKRSIRPVFQNVTRGTLTFIYSDHNERNTISLQRTTHTLWILKKETLFK